MQQPESSGSSLGGRAHRLDRGGDGEGGYRGAEPCEQRGDGTAIAQTTATAVSARVPASRRASIAPTRSAANCRRGCSRGSTATSRGNTTCAATAAKNSCAPNRDPQESR